MPKTIAIIQARMGSTRLPGKILMDIQGHPMLWHIIERVKQAKLIDAIIVATSDNKIDDPLEKYLESIGVYFYRGSEDNVLERFYEASLLCGAETIVRLTGDNCLIDPNIIDSTILYFKDTKFRYVSNIKQPSAKCTFPVGVACEVFTFELLDEAYHKAKESYEKEHVTPYMYYQQKSIGCYSNHIDLSNYRFTVDTLEDYEYIKVIYRYFFKGEHDFYLNDIIRFLKEHPEIAELNTNAEQKKVK
ncbi:MAG: glycosyltransferase family protein [Clostridia bacterium]|jgi:spore coat polysaccharide biosynthesis protein SpsF